MGNPLGSIGRETTGTLAFGCVLASIGMLVLAGRHPASSLPFVYAVLIAFGYGVLSPVFPAVASDLFAGPGFSTIYGALYGVICLGLAAGAWSARKIFDVTGSYGVALWIGVEWRRSRRLSSGSWRRAGRTPHPSLNDQRRVRSRP